MARSTRAYDFLLDHVALPPSPRLLDLGAGQESGTAHFSRRFPQATVLGLDISFDCLPHPQPIPCHQSQMVNSPMLDAPEARQYLFLGTEYFQRKKRS